MTTQNRRFGVVIGQALGFDCADALFSTDLQSARSRVAARLGQGSRTGQAAQLCLHPVRGQLGALPPPVRQQAGDHAQHRAPGRRGTDVQPRFLRRAGLLGRTHHAGHGDARTAGRLPVPPQIRAGHPAPRREAVVTGAARTRLLRHQQREDGLQLQGRHEAGLGHVLQQGHVAQAAKQGHAVFPHAIVRRLAREPAALSAETNGDTDQDIAR